jgi:hypothetical protein
VHRTEQAHWATKTQELHKNILKHLEPFFSKMLLSQVTADHTAITRIFAKLPVHPTAQSTLKLACYDWR